MSGGDSHLTMVTQTLKNELPGGDLLLNCTNISKLFLMHIKLYSFHHMLSEVIQFIELKASLVRIIKQFLEKVSDKGLSLGVRHLHIKIVVTVHDYIH